jgi:hypothetical protein
MDLFLRFIQQYRGRYWVRLGDDERHVLWMLTGVTFLFVGFRLLFSMVRVLFGQRVTEYGSRVNARRGSRVIGT